MASKKTRTINDGFTDSKIKVTTVKQAETGIDTEKQFISDILDAAQANNLDLNSINNLVQGAQNREQTYELIDVMSQDEIIAAGLETYTEDTIQPNEKGDIVWVESEKPEVLDYVKWILDSLNISKNIYQWVHCLVTYGDVYLRLFRESDENNDLLFENKNALNEDVKLKIYPQSDHYIPYVEMIDNPGEMFDLQKFGKTHGYIKAPVAFIQPKMDNGFNNAIHSNYQFKSKDVEIFDGTSFVHGCLERTNQRQTETVTIYLDSDKNIQKNTPYKGITTTTEDTEYTTYAIKRGQSILYNSFKVWRELNLLELSALLNRLTKSSLVRIVTVQVGDMPKEKVRVYIDRLKQMMEQKTALKTDNSMQNYNEAGPIENTIYVPVSADGKGNISVSNVGGDFDPKSLVDIEYFRNKLMASLKIPRQFLGCTDDNTGFNGGSSLTIISSRYGKTIKRIQSVIKQMITDIINLFLIDRKMDKYVNKFTIRMQPIVTQEEIDARTAAKDKLDFISSFMSQLGDIGIEDPVSKLKIFKSLAATAVNNSTIIAELEKNAQKLEEAEKEKKKKAKGSEEESEVPNEDENLPELEESKETVEKDILIEAGTLEDDKEELNEENDEVEDSYMPSPAELKLGDMTDDNLFDVRGEE